MLYEKKQGIDLEHKNNKQGYTTHDSILIGVLLMSVLTMQILHLLFLILFLSKFSSLFHSSYASIKPVPEL